MSSAPATKKVAKKAAAPADHPKYSAMIKAAIGALKERNGSSSQAIKKYIIANFKVGTNASIVVNRTIKGMVKKGAVVQTKGTGASGSFKLAPKAEKAPLKKAAPKKAASKAPAAKKPKVAKAKPAAKATKSPKKPAVKKPKSPKKAKKAVVKKPATKKTPVAKKTAAKK
jgi:hypothetical protein